MEKKSIYFKISTSLIFLLGILFVNSNQAQAADPNKIVLKNASWQKTTVSTTRGKFAVQIVSVNLLNPKLKIYTLTGNPTDCKNNCRVSPLKAYVDRVKGFAGINGTYFCPASYASCAGQTGSYFWMVYNSLTKTFVNSYQNKFNSGPLIAFDSENHWHFWRQAKDWPGLANFEKKYQTKLRALFSSGPALVVDKQLVLKNSELDTKQRTVKSARCGTAFKSTNAYVLCASNATVMDLAYIMKALGMEYAINQDGGGSASIVFLGQYRLGPGRNLPNVLVFSEYSFYR
ncbi:MAG: phosphodiester glycosidase family protein [Patescibacteria group bacterium]